MARKAEVRFSRESPENRRRMLIEAAARCLAEHGLQGFTIDRICREANVSRGLISHYFAGKDDLLVEVYRSSLYGAVTAQLNAGDGAATARDRLTALIDASFTAETFARSNLLVWLALWAAVATTPLLQEAHRDLYRAYRSRLAEAIAALAAERHRALDAAALARNLIALIDGLWLEWCLDDTALTPTDARQACYDLLEARLGTL